MLNIVVPLAGHGKRFAETGFEMPKPLIPVLGKPMIQMVVEQLKTERDHRFHFIVLREHVRYRFHFIVLREHVRFGLPDLLHKAAPGCSITYLDEVTDGAARTVLKCRDEIDNKDQLLIANCDQWINFPITRLFNLMRLRDFDAVTAVWDSDNPAFSYIRTNGTGGVNEVAEKKIIGTMANMGLYAFHEGRYFVEAADEMIRQDIRTNGEFYVAPALNEMIKVGMKVGYEWFSKDEFHSLGTPAHLEQFLSWHAKQVFGGSKQLVL